MTTPDRARATPTKAFFVEMLVKDVSLESAVLDLVDNCIDGAKRLRGDGPYTGLGVRIVVNAEEFRIEDNCGGIDVDVARNYAFRFGRDPAVTPIQRSLGVFGVGMKRAIFKIGRDIVIRSTTRSNSFLIQENIPRWQERDDPDGWYFPMEVEELAVEPSEDEQGTAITITGLYDSIRQQFGSEYFAGGLRRSISTKHQRHIDNGLSVMVNDTSIPGTSVQFAYVPNSQLVPAFEQRPLDGVAMQLYAGIGELDRPMAGWYIYCNGRMIIEHDQTERTGWGDSIETAIPKFHHQFARFRGCVFFDSDDSSKLPWNTTKDGIDVGSEVYRTARVRMITHMRTIIDFLNKLDRELEEPDESKRVLFSLLDRASYGAPWEIPKASKFTYQTATVERPPEYSRATIHRPKAEMDRLKRCLGARSNKEALEIIFDWYLENECSDAE